MSKQSLSDFAETKTKKLPKRKNFLTAVYEGKEIPRRASGGPVKKDKEYLVGENGPEVFVPESDGVVVPKVYTEDDRVVQDAEFAKRYDGAKYYGLKKDLADYEALKKIIEARPNGRRARLRIEKEVDAKYKKE